MKYSNSPSRNLLPGMINSSAFLGEIMISGVYRIYFKKTGQSYYGSSSNIWRRWNEHRSYLRRNKHANEKLQFCWNNSIEEDVLFEVLIKCKKNEFESIERNFIAGDSNSLNIWIDPFSPKGSGRSIDEKMKGKPRPNCRHPHTEETKKKLRILTKQYFEKNTSVCLGKPRTEEVKRKVSEGLKRYFAKNISPHKVKPKSKEVREKISNTLKRRSLA